MSLDGIQDSRVISTEALDSWFEYGKGHVKFNQSQLLSLNNLKESIDRLRRTRADLHLSSMQMKETHRLNKTTSQVQTEIHHATVSYFQDLYNCLSQLASTVNRFPKIFVGIKTNSNTKFLDTTKALYPDLADAVDLLERARTYRTFVDHPVINQVSNWVTTFTDDARIVEVIYYGDKSSSGNIPKYAEEGGIGIVASDWYMHTPDHFEVENSIKELTLKIISEIRTALRIKDTAFVEIYSEDPFSNDYLITNREDLLSKNDLMLLMKLCEHMNLRKNYRYGIDNTTNIVIAVILKKFDDKEKAFLCCRSIHQSLYSWFESKNKEEKKKLDKNLFVRYDIKIGLKVYTFLLDIKLEYSKEKAMKIYNEQIA